jgi:hypothetical protein
MIVQIIVRSDTGGIISNNSHNAVAAGGIDYSQCVIDKDGTRISGYRFHPIVEGFDRYDSVTIQAEVVARMHKLLERTYKLIDQDGKVDVSDLRNELLALGFGLEEK